MKLGEVANAEPIAVDIATAPEQIGNWAPLPQPGRGYLFQLPVISADHDVDEIESDKGARVAVRFGGRKEGMNYPDPLLVLAGPDDQAIGNPLSVRLSNEERSFGGPEDEAGSQLFYLLMAFGEDMSHKGNADYLNALMAHGGEKFKADLGWTGRCSEDRDIYMVNPDTGEGAVQEGVKGCGTRFSSRPTKTNRKGVTTWQAPREIDDEGKEIPGGRFLERFNCTCNARISLFPELNNFQPDPEKAEEIKAKIKAAKEAAKARANQPQAAAPQAPAPAAAPVKAATPVAAIPAGAKAVPAKAPQAVAKKA